jgi:hypothetical protein
MESGGIFGPKLSGKTTLAKEISRQYWERSKRRSLVLDINLETWGPHAWVTDDEEQFLRAVCQQPIPGLGGISNRGKPSLIIVDEATETINRDKTLVRVFTRLRHLHHKLLVIGHDGTNLLRIMREQIDTLYLFRSSPKAAEMWADSMTQQGFLEAENLDQYEFLYGERFKAPVKRMLELKTVRRIHA